MAYRIILIGILIVLANYVEAQNPDSVANNEYCIYSSVESIKITDIKRTISETRLTFMLSDMPGTKYKIPNNLYLEDSKQLRYKCIGSEGVTIGSVFSCPLSEQQIFTLVFDPVPLDEQFFDLFSADEVFRWFAFWGIGTTSFVFPNAIEDKSNIYVDSNLFAHGEVTVKCRFLGEHPRRLDFQYLSGSTFKAEKIEISDDGEFEFTCSLDQAYWTYLENIDVRIPLFLTPGDTLSIVVSDCYGINTRIHYTSARGYDTHSSLMMADPFYTNTIRNTIPMNTPLRPSELKRIANKMQKEESKLQQYLVWKYKLSPTDSHLLNLYMQSFQIDYLNSCIHSTLSKVYPGRTILKNPTKCKELIYSKEMAECYWFLQDLDFTDPGTLIIPYHYIYKTVTDNYPAHLAYLLEGKEEAFTMIENMAKSSLSEFWKKKLSHKYK